MVRGAVMATVAGVLCATGCTSAQAPAMRTSGKVMALGGVLGLVGAAFATNATDLATEMMIGFEIISAVGVVSYAYAELTWPDATSHEETTTERHRRWAQILTERASGAAREGRCARVRRLERRVHDYDREIHDILFMKDPEIRRCLTAASPGAEGAEDAEDADPDRPGDGEALPSPSIRDTADLGAADEVRAAPAAAPTAAPADASAGAAPVAAPPLTAPLVLPRSTPAAPLAPPPPPVP